MTITDNAGPVDNRESKRSALRTLPFPAVHIDAGFWATYQEINRSVSLVHGFSMLEEAGNLQNLRIAAGLAEGEFAGYWFADSDVYKWLEAAAWELGRGEDAGLRSMVDQAIALVEQAQQPNGYLNSYFQITKTEPWSDLDHGHELYCAGHLIQAAIASERALGDNRLMQVTLKFVNQIERIFGANGRDETCGHPEIEMALVELYRVTGDEQHLAMAELFVDRRGRKKMRGHAGYGPVYQQDHVPIREATEVVGHAVRQLYLTTGATDLAMESGEEALIEAMHTLWSDMTERKMYITGGVGSRFDGEAFGGPYELPSDTSYCETCAAIASMMWNWRLLLLTGRSRYADLFERALYNGVLSSPGLEGASYLYVNPLQVRGGRYVRASANTGTGEERMRPSWHSCACCPPNVMRTLSSLSHYLATIGDGGLQVHQYAAAQISTTIGGGEVIIGMETDYPWGGEIKIDLIASPQSSWSLSLRLPEWCRQYSLMLNGRELPVEFDEMGYLVIERKWQVGDEVLLSLAMEPVFIAPNPRIDALRGCVALERGPLVYCFESQDQPDGLGLLDVQVSPSATVSSTAIDGLGEMRSVKVPGQAVASTWGDKLYRQLDEVPRVQPQEVDLTAIPYFLWGNRGMKSMRVWVPLAAKEAA